MIKNKQIVITKQTFFDKGWSIVTPFILPRLTNMRLRPLNISDIVRAISYADCINLVLSEPCLSGPIVKELLWVNKFAPINIIAKEQSVIDAYPHLRFASEKTDIGVCFNYIAVEGKENVFAFISDCYVATNKRVNDIYFKNATPQNGFCLPENVKSVIVTDENNDGNYADVIALCKNRNIPLIYVVGANAYTEEAVKKFRTSNLIFLCAQRVNDGILYTTDDGALYCVNTANNEFISVEVRSFEYYFDAPYKNRELPDIVAVKDIPAYSYACTDGKITELHIEKTKEINRTVQIDSMEDFLNEKFDRSEIDSYNRYCTSAESVTYVFTLIPPQFDPNGISDIYDEANRQYERWKKISQFPISDICTDLRELGLQDSRICSLCQKITEFDKVISYGIGNLRFENFVDKSKAFFGTISSVLDDFTVCCEELFTAVNEGNSETKFDKIDSEISGYKRTIEEKTALIEQGIEVLSNRDRIKRLEKKIADLTALKTKFASGASTRDNRQAEAFAEFCKSVLSGVYEENNQSVDSIGNVITVKQDTKLSGLETFVKKRLRVLYAFFNEVKSVADGCAKLDIPSEYIVYTQNGRRVIAIESEREYYETADLRKRFNVSCVAAKDGKQKSAVNLMNVLKNMRNVKEGKI